MCSPVRSRVPQRCLCVDVGRRTGDRSGQGGRLLTPILLTMHGLGVDTEAHIVEERAAVGDAVVDQDLLAVTQRVEGGQRVASVEPKVQRKMIAGTDRNAEERDAPLDRNAGHQPKRAVSSCHSNSVGAGTDGVMGQPGEIIASLQHDRANTRLLCLVGQATPVRLAVTAPAIDDQCRSRRPILFAYIWLRSAHQSAHLSPPEHSRNREPSDKASAQRKPHKPDTAARYVRYLVPLGLHRHTNPILHLTTTAATVGLPHDQLTVSVMRPDRPVGRMSRRAAGHADFQSRPIQPELNPGIASELPV